MAKYTLDTNNQSDRQFYLLSSVQFRSLYRPRIRLVILPAPTKRNKPEQNIDKPI